MIFEISKQVLCLDLTFHQEVLNAAACQSRICHCSWVCAWISSLVMLYNSHGAAVDKLLG
jgi:hypothetical protein